MLGIDDAVFDQLLLVHQFTDQLQLIRGGRTWHALRRFVSSVIGTFGFRLVLVVGEKRVDQLGRVGREQFLDVDPTLFKIVELRVVERLELLEVSLDDLLLLVRS